MGKEESFPIQVPHSKRPPGFQWDCFGLKRLGKSHMARVRTETRAAPDGEPSPGTALRLDKVELRVRAVALAARSPALLPLRVRRWDKASALTRRTPAWRYCLVLAQGKPKRLLK